MVTQEDSLAGQVAVVTGANRGMGRAIALELARAGARLVVAGRNRPSLEGVAAEIRGGGGEAVVALADVTQPRQVEGMVQVARQAYGGIDLLVNNAGMVHRVPLMQTDERQWDEQIRVNLTGVFLCSLAVAPIMIEQRRGHIINIASNVGIISVPNLGPYGAAKAGVIMLTRALAKELAKHGVRVNAVAPGLVQTDMSRSIWTDPETLRSRIASIPLGRMGEPEDIARLVRCLASPASRFMTGATIVADGGAVV